MTREDIIRMAREADLNVHDPAIELLQRFAKQVAEHEREACAKLCDDLDDDLPDGLAGWQYGEAIRARGEQT